LHYKKVLFVSRFFKEKPKSKLKEKGEERVGKKSCEDELHNITPRPCQVVPLSHKRNNSYQEVFRASEVSNTEMASFRDEITNSGGAIDEKSVLQRTE